jgi:hypothetical protein
MKRALFALLLFAAVAVTAAEPPEHIISFYFPKEGSEEALQAAILENFATMSKLDVIFPSPRILLRGKDAKGRPYFVSVFTWRSASIPDNAPPEIRKNWAKLESLVEPRDGRRGIDFDEVDMIPVK